MKLTKSELQTKLTAIHNMFDTSLHVTFILKKTGEVTWSEIPDNINLISFRIDFETHQVQCNFKPLNTPVRMINIFRDCYDQHNSCCGCRWFDSAQKTCIFQGRALDEWPELIEYQGYELEDKLW